MDWPLELQHVPRPRTLPVAPAPGKRCQVTWYDVEHRPERVEGPVRFLVRNWQGRVLAAAGTWGGVLRILGWMPPFKQHSFPALHAATYTGRLAPGARVIRDDEPTERLPLREVLAARAARAGLTVAAPGGAPLIYARDLADADRQRAILRRMSGLSELRILWGDTLEPVTQRQAALMGVTTCKPAANTSSSSPSPNPRPPEGSRSPRSHSGVTTATPGACPASALAGS